MNNGDGFGVLRAGTFHRTQGCSSISIYISQEQLATKEHVVEIERETAIDIIYIYIYVCMGAR